MKKSILTLIAVFAIRTLSAQEDWRVMMQDPNANFYDIKKAAEAYWDTHDKDEKGCGYKPYKRWEAFMEPRVYPTGNLYLASQAWANYEAYINQNMSTAKQGNNMIASSTWTAIGPFGAMTGSACGLPRKAGRDNFITFHPTIPTTYWVGSPAGGLWKTTTDGTSWSTTTDNLSVIGCSDLAVDPTNPNIMYMATGDGDAGDTYCIGVLKSTDGGATWNTTGLTWTVNQQRMMRRLIINPINPQILIAASSAGIWRTTNGGTNWTQVSTINAYDVEFKPNNPNVVYAGGGATGTTVSFYRSTNGGGAFTVISNGIPTTGCPRLAIAVTPADTNYVYVLRSNTTYGFGGLYRSVAGGTVFTSMSTTPDILANSCAGTAGNGQGWYDLALAASPLNKDEVVVGGINHWRSTNGGTSWTNIGCWNSTAANPPYVHADVHDLKYTSAGTLFSCNDGGVYKYTGTAWTDLSSPRNIAQQYRIGLSALTANLFVTGHQDNGTNMYNGTTYAAKYCGDGMDCFIDRTNNSNVFGATPQGGFIRSTDGGTTWGSAQSGMSGTAAWVAPWHQDPVSAATLYAGRSQIFKSTNSGASWAQVTATGGSGTIVEFAIAPSNNQVLYVIHGTVLYKTTDGGVTWTNVNTGLPNNKTYVAIDPTDPNQAWVTVSGYTAGSKVFMTTNGGTSWTNISSNLPNLPANCIMYEPGTSDRVYVGMDVGVYYKDNSTTNWTLYNTGLPNVPISDLEMSAANPGKIFAATYGRGAWKVDVVTAAPPSSSFSVSATALCSGTNIQFTDNSANSPTSWSWSVTPAPGVTINTSTSQNPTINFTNGGSYVVSMQASNIIGPGSVASQTITVVATPTVTVANNSQTVCAGSPVTYTASGATTYAWSGGGTAAINTYTPSANTVYTVTGTTSGCSSQKTASVTVNALPTVNITGVTAICIGNSAVLTGNGASTYTWNTSATTTTISVNPTVTTSYTVTGTGSNGCKNSAVTTLTVNPLPTLNVSTSSSAVCIGQNANLNVSGASTYTWMPGSLVGAAVVTTPTANTIYTVTGTSAAGCNNTATRNVTVNPLPTINTTISNAVICSGQSTTLTATGATTYTWNPGGITGSAVALNPTTSTVYTVTGTNSNGCNNTAVRSVTVNPTPTVNTTASNSSICTGQSATLTATGATSYTWNPGGATTSAIAITPTASVTYTVVGSNGSGCSGSTVRTITVNPLPTVAATSSSSLICTGQTATLSATGAATYTWNPGGATGANATVTPTVSTTYTVNGTSAQGCSKTAMVTVSVSSCTGIEQIVNAGGYSIFPNPTTGKLNIQYSVTKATAINAEVVDASGKVVMKQTLVFGANENTQIINMAHLSNGLYFINLTNSDNKSQTIRIVKD